MNRWQFGGRNIPSAFLFVFTLLYGAAVMVIVTGRKNYRRGVEHGSARWGNVAQVAKRYRDRQHPYRNLILTQHFQMGLDGHRHKRNTNVLVIGGSGAGKSRSYRYALCRPTGRLQQCARQYCRGSDDVRCRDCSQEGGGNGV